MRLWLEFEIEQLNQEVLTDIQADLGDRMEAPFAIHATILPVVQFNIEASDPATPTPDSSSK